MQYYDVIILGGGASGLMCALTAAERKRRVLIIDHAKQLGRKLLVTGGGKCNCTNRRVTWQDYVGSNPQFTRSCLSRFAPDDLLDLLDEQGVPYEEREEGQIFCLRSAQDILNMLLGRCRQAGVTFNLSTQIDDISHTPKVALPFTVTTSQGRFQAASLVIATGGLAWPQVGATGIGYTIAKQFGHMVTPPGPALAGLIMPPQWPLQGLEGISLRVTLTHRPVKKGSDQKSPLVVANNLALLFTHKGISGPATLQASLYFERGDTLICNFLPGLSVPEALQKYRQGKALVKGVFQRLLPERLLSLLLPEAILQKKCAELCKSDQATIIQALTEYSLHPLRVDSLHRAEVSKGGINIQDISSKSMESSLVAGLFFCGEVLDVTGRLGGYNLHFAFASGQAAGSFC